MINQNLSKPFHVSKSNVNIFLVLFRLVVLHDSLKAQKADIGLIIQSQCELKKTQIIFQDLVQKEYRNIKLIDGRDMVEMLIELMVQTKAATNLPN